MSGKFLVFDHECTSCAHVFEELVYLDGPHPACPKCATPNATRLLAAPRIDPKLGVSSAFPTMADKWARVRRQRQKIADKLQREHGDIR